MLEYLEENDSAEKKTLISDENGGGEEYEDEDEDDEDDDEDDDEENDEDTNKETPKITRRADGKRTIEFSGYTWVVKANEQKVGPGPNYFSDRGEDIWVDEKGNLHMKIVKRNGKWYGTEVYTEESFGYGNYIFKVDGFVDQLNENTVVGLFTWDGNAPEHNYREIDIEFARWGDMTYSYGLYSVQPWRTAGNIFSFNEPLHTKITTHGFSWRPTQIFFQSLHGDKAFPGEKENEISSWTYLGADIPPAGNENARINFWLLNGTPPSDNKEAKIIIKSFAHVL